LQLAGNAPTAVALQELRNDDGVMQNRVGSQTVILLERHYEPREIVA
jgi:hypothetical protein